MDAGLGVLLRLILPRLPLILKTAILNALSQSPNSSRQDLITEVTVTFIRSLVQVRKPISFSQKVTARDPGIKGPIWISKVTIPAPVDTPGPLEAVCQAIKELGDGTETYTLPDVADVEAEWTGYAHHLKAGEPRLQISEHEHYKRLMDEVSSPVTIMYLHGGAYFLMDPATVRDPVSRYCKLTGGRAYSVRYRLAPQNPFPAQLLDALVAYLSLLSPPPGSPHQPVSPRHIVVAGDSAGGNLTFALLLLLLTLHKMGITSIKFHGKDVDIPLPAGVVGNSPWVDVTRSSASIFHNAHFDYLDPPSTDGNGKSDPIPDKIWPASPPRADIFCNASILTHPLVSPIAAAPELWKAAPPIWMCLGNEGLEDEICVIARRMHQGGATVQLAGYEGMPHCFAMIFPQQGPGKDCFARCTDFMKAVTGGERDQVASYATWMKAFSKPLVFEDVSFDNASKLTDQEVLEAMAKMKARAIEKEEAAVKEWSERQTRARL